VSDLADAARAAQAPPPQAHAAFGDNFAAACRYADLLCTDGVERGLIGPREPARIWSRHLLNAAALAAFVPDGARVLDVGSGAGLPGIPLLLARPDLRMTLVEPMMRRTAFCLEVRDALALRLEVLRVRAEQAPKASADVVVARAVAPLDRLVSMALPLLRPGGVLLALKGELANAELHDAQPLLRRLGITEATVAAIGDGEDRTYVIRLLAPADEIASARKRGSRATARAKGVR
jgi:16S rRNA (guanine527-N7)-methyltransferase